ncbi:DUF427 domain-containing protein [Candidatus Dojkabacteria bacterium]|uniref:DUF427 domain-containing protein n=1 Tax=Candidatus Dojkabacteria bacterium TaxID=2099670 RepID=A0A955L8G7_9BACT|nr:DUF427 domain-containing protein [Candidatus Dojkabacteria bacterium]
MKALWNGVIIAESDETEIVEGNHYFPPQSVDTDYLEKSEFTTTCPWKGKASYYSLKVGDKTNENAAWYYPEPSDAAKNIKNYIAFWNGVEVVE